MQFIPGFLSLRKNYDALLAALAGWGMLLLLTHYGGIGVSPDSVVYTSVARNMQHQWALVDYNLLPLVDFPVFYPMFLGCFLFITRTDPVAGGPVLNGLLFGSLIYLCGCILQRWPVFSRSYKWFILACLVLSPSLLEIYSMLWSETLFILLSVVFIILYRHYNRTRSLAALAAAAACISLACVTRYAGIALLGAGGLLLLFDYALPWKKKWLHLLVFGTVSLLLLVLNLWRNYTITHTLTGMREKGVTPFSRNLYYCGTVLCDWLPFMQGHYAWATGIAVLGLLVPAWFLLMRWLRKQVYHDYENIFTAWALVYALFIVVSATLSRYEQINNRLLSPLYIPLLVCLTGWLPRRLRQKRVKAGKWLLPVLGCCFLLGALASARNMYNEVKDYGIPGYTDDSWRQSPIARYLKTHPHVFRPEHTVYSNAPDAVYFVSGLSAYTLPHTVDTSDVRDFNGDPEQYVIWFNQIDDQDLISRSYLLQHKKTIPLYQAADGIIYWCANSADSLALPH
jgi:hypothetical protein